MMSTASPPLLMEASPQLANELQELLKGHNESQLAAEVPALRIVDRCRCGDDFCATLYTQPKPKRTYPPGTRSLDLNPDKGMLILVVVNGKIACVEALYRDEIRRVLHSILP